MNDKENFRYLGSSMPHQLYRQSLTMGHWAHVCDCMRKSSENNLAIDYENNEINSDKQNLLNDRSIKIINLEQVCTKTD